MISLLKKYWISILLNTIILFLCFVNTAPVMPELPMTNLDKLVHLLMFLALSGSVFFDNTGYFKQRITGRRIILGSFLFPFLFSGFIEILQEYCSSSRSGDWLDFLFDGIGALTGIAICFLINSKLKGVR